MTKTKKALLVLLSSVAVVAVALIWDMAWFASIVRDYKNAAAAGFHIKVDPIPEEAIVVLTGDHRRIPQAFELLIDRKSAFLVISGTGKTTTLTDVVNQQGGSSTAKLHEVWSKILVESQSSSTIENAIESGKILAGKNVKRVILITSDYHMYRSLRIFRKLLPQYEYVPYPVSSGLTEMSLVPSSVAIVALWRTWLEYWKVLHLRLRLAPIPA